MSLRSFALGLVSIGLFAAAASAQAGTIADVKARGHLQCGVVTDYAGFGYLDNQGKFQGFDVDFCRAIAAALGVETQFTKLDGKTRFPALQSGEVDVVIMLVTDTMSRETALGFDFPAVNFYDGQGYMVHKDLNVKSVKELNGASVCVTSGGTGAINTADFFRAHNMTYKPVEYQRIDDANHAYDEGRCDAIIGQTANLAALRATLKDPEANVILPELISKEPMGPVTRSNDRQFSQAVRWVVNGLLFAEERGITQANVADMAAKSADPEVRRFLGAEGTLGKDAGLPNDWAVTMIKAVGNYGEIFNRNVGPNTIFKMSRGLNALWNQGGLQYPLPFN
jgi:general L-amino acid transport system substrate-binding protein